MSDDLDNKIDQLSNMFGQGQVPDNVKNLIKSFLSSEESEDDNSKEEKEEKRVSKKDSKNETNSGQNELLDNVEMMSRVSSIMRELNSTKDSRVNLLTAVKPFLSEKRQGKVANCIKIIQMSKVARVLEKTDLSKL